MAMLVPWRRIVHHLDISTSYQYQNRSKAMDNQLVALMMPVFVMYRN
jgi:hypothetical protein